MHRDQLVRDFMAVTFFVKLSFSVKNAHFREIVRKPYFKNIASYWKVFKFLSIHFYNTENFTD